MYIFNKYEKNIDWVNSVITSIQEKLDDSENSDFISISLSGGSTPYPIYSNFNKLNINWAKVNLISTDERYVEDSSKYYNWSKIQESIGNDIILKAHQVINFEYFSGDIDKSIDEFKQKLPTKCNITILGVGEDGHIASLFPFNEYLVSNTSEVLSTEAPDNLDIKKRLSLSINYIMGSDHLILLLKGENKQNIINIMLDDNINDTSTFPVKIILKHPNIEIHYLLK